MLNCGIASPLPRCASTVLHHSSNVLSACASRLLHSLSERLGRHALQGAPQADEQQAAADSAERRVCRVGLIGFPNAGKSQLTNQLTGVKVTAVSPKAHTTREPQLGAFTLGTTQVVLYDTPGFAGSQKHGRSTHAARVKSAWQTAQLCDVLLFIVDADQQHRHPTSAIYDAAATLTTGPPTRELPLPSWQALPAALVLNKVDLLPPAHRKLVLTILSERLQKHHAFGKCFHVSALKGHGIPALRKYLLAKAQLGQWPLAAEQATDKGPAELAEELVRERLYLHLREHLPYRMQPRAQYGRVLLDGAHSIKLVLPVQSHAVKRIVIGAGGQVIQDKVVAPAQRELEQVLGARVQLVVDVTVAGC